MAILLRRYLDSAVENQLLGYQTEQEHVNCYNCAGSSATFFVSAVDDLSGMPGIFYFVSCDNCGLVYQNPRIRLEHIPAYYDDNYIAYRRRTDWGFLSKFHQRSMQKHDRDKDLLISKYLKLSSSSKIIDFGCATGSFSGYLRKKYSCVAWGTDFKDFSKECHSQDVNFLQGVVSELPLSSNYYDLVTMWHFLEHDYDPLKTLQITREILKKDGLAIIEVPRLDSLSFKLFTNRWPGLQAPQHTALYTKESLRKIVEKAGLTIVEHLSYGAFPAFFYFYAGFIFHFTKGKGVNFRKHIAPYFISQLISLPLFAIFAKSNLAMQTVVCKKR